MKRPKLYLETSVWNFYFADDAPEKRDATIRFFEQVKLGYYDIFISTEVVREISDANQEKQKQLFSLISEFQPVNFKLEKDAILLANTYIEVGVLTSKSLTDARHAALATIHELDALISWNMKHLANFRKMQLFNATNFQEGYTKRLELITPMEVSENGK